MQAYSNTITTQSHYVPFKRMGQWCFIVSRSEPNERDNAKISSGSQAAQTSPWLLIAANKKRSRQGKQRTKEEEVRGGPVAG